MTLPNSGTFLARLTTSWPVPVRRSDIKPTRDIHPCTALETEDTEHARIAELRRIIRDAHAHGRSIGVGPALLVTAVVSLGAAAAVRVTVTPEREDRN